MPDPRARAGILSFSTYVPRAYHDAEHIAARSETPAEIIRTKLGWYQKNVPGPGDHTAEMGLRAARKALHASGLEPDDIDAVIWSGEEVKEHRCWPVGTKLEKELGLGRAWSLDLQQRCGTTLVALKLARDLIRADDRVRNVLVATGYRNSDLIDYANPRLRWMFYLAAGGAACVVQRDCPRNEILEGHFMSDGSFSGDVYVPAGGSARPMTRERLAAGEGFLEVFDAEGMKKRLERLSLTNWLECIDRALAKCGATRAEVDYLATLLVKRSAHDYLVSALGIDPEQTRYLEEFGHHGQNDQILSLELGLEEGRLHEGDLVLMISAGIGYAWDALALRWGRAEPAPPGAGQERPRPARARESSPEGGTEPIGIAGHGVFVPDGRLGADRIAELSGLSVAEVRALGLESRVEPGPEDQPVAMAAAAARRALESADGIGADDVDVVIWTGEEHKDHVAQTASIRLQEEVGARRAWAFDLVGQGVTTLVGLRVARALMLGDPEVRTVLLAGASRHVDLVDPREPATRWMLATGAAGAALLLRRGLERNRLLAVVSSDDPALADDVFVPVGGTVEPYTAENLDGPGTRFRVARPELVSRYLAETLPRRLVSVVRAALAEAGRGTGAPPGYLALRHLAPAQARAVLEGLELRAGATDGLSDLGHAGPHDVVVSLERGLCRGAISEGDTVVLAAAGIGFTYAAAVVEWGAARAAAGPGEGPWSHDRSARPRPS